MKEVDKREKREERGRKSRDTLAPSPSIIPGKPIGASPALRPEWQQRRPGNAGGGQRLAKAKERRHETKETLFMPIRRLAGPNPSDGNG